MPAVTSFQGGLYYPEHGATPHPAIIVETVTPSSSASNRPVVNCVVFFADGNEIEYRTAIHLSLTDPTATGIGGHFKS